MLNDLRAEKLRNILEFVLSPDVTSSGWLGSKHQLINELTVRSSTVARVQRTDGPSWPMPCSCDSSCSWTKRFHCAVVCFVVKTAGISVCFLGNCHRLVWTRISYSSSQYWRKLLRAQFQISVSFLSRGAASRWNDKTGYFLPSLLHGLAKAITCCICSSQLLGRFLVKYVALSTLTYSFR